MMLDFKACKEIAASKAAAHNTEISKSYLIGSDFAFDTKDEIVGLFPLVVFPETGDTMQLWHYAGEKNVTYDDLVEIEE